jgi:hypothetical protein
VNADQFIAARVSSHTKQQLRALAQREHVSESALLKRLLETAFQFAGMANPVEPEPPRPGSRAARLYVRVHPDDQLLLTERAAARGNRFLRLPVPQARALSS